MFCNFFRKGLKFFYNFCHFFLRRHVIRSPLLPAISREILSLSPTLYERDAEPYQHTRSEDRALDWQAV